MMNTFTSRYVRVTPLLVPVTKLVEEKEGEKKGKKPLGKNDDAYSGMLTAALLHHYVLAFVNFSE